MQYSLPVILDYDGKKRIVEMGPFEHSMEREFSMAVNKKAIDECQDIKQLKEVAGNLLVGWSNLQGAVGELIKENIKLRHAIQLQDRDLEAAEKLMMEAAELIEKRGVDHSKSPFQSSQSRKRWWQLWK